MLSVALALAVAPVPAGPEIEVRAERLTERQVEARARDFVRNVLPAPSFGRYARWTQPVCPRVTGIADVYAAIVEARVRAAATAAGVPLARPGCRTNLSITFGEDAKVTAGVIPRRKPKQVAKLDRVQRDRLLNSALPGCSLTAAPACSAASWSAPSRRRSSPSSPAVPGCRWRS